MRGKSDSATRQWIYHVAGEGKKWIGLLTLVRIGQGINTILYGNISMQRNRGEQ